MRLSDLRLNDSKSPLEPWRLLLLFSYPAGCFHSWAGGFAGTENLHPESIESSIKICYFLPSAPARRLPSLDLFGRFSDSIPLFGCGFSRLPSIPSAVMTNDSQSSRVVGDALVLFHFPPPLRRGLPTLESMQSTTWSFRKRTGSKKPAFLFGAVSRCKKASCSLGCV